MKHQPTLFLTGKTAQFAAAFVEHAVIYATGAHGEQTRKYTAGQTPYVEHCIAVAETVATVTDDAEVIAAAVLHDTIEDTPVGFTDILLSFGPRVARLVLEVTDASTPADGNRAVRKAIDRAHLAKSSPDGATIKLADIIDNTQDIVAKDPNFARLYLEEKAAVLPLLKHGNERLWNDAARLVYGAIEKREMLGPELMLPAA